MTDIFDNLRDFFRPTLRPARFIVLLISLHFIGHINYSKLFDVLQDTTLADIWEIWTFLSREINVFELLEATFIAFLINPSLTALIAKLISDLLKPFAAPLILELNSMRNISRLNQLSSLERMRIFDSYLKSRNIFLALRELIELIIPFSCIIFLVANDRLTGAISSVIVALLLFWLCVQRLLILFLRDIAPYELIRSKP